VTSQPPKPAPTRPLPALPAGPHILVVAGDEIVRDSLSRILGQRWTTLAFGDAAAALSAARERPPDLVVVDGGTLGPVGDTLIRDLRRDPKVRRLPILLIAAPSASDHWPQEMDVGADEYLSPPVKPRDLLARAAAHLQLARVREEASRREQAARLEAEAANRAKDEFIAMISHELRTPLGAILIWTQLLRTEELDTTATTRAVGMIERSTKALAQLIDDLLDVSRIIAGKLTLEPRPVDLPSVLEAALEAAQHAARAKSLTLEKSLVAGLPAISGEAGRLQQVLANLLTNAIKFTPEGGRVEVSLDRVGSAARVRVTDTGSGIAPEFLPFIFDRFSQADTTSTRKQKGLGLGLAIARHLVELHGGTIEATSPGEGKGTTFTVTLPLAGSDEVPTRRTEERAATDADLRGVRVLVVDDEADAREATVVLLRQCGADVVGAPSASDALDRLDREVPDVLLSDVAMPGEDGYELIRRVRDRAPERGGKVAAAALTAYATQEDRSKALRAGFDEHIPKPVDPVRLVGTIAALVRRAR
jgi:signal transduction histidine kinase